MKRKLYFLYAILATIIYFSLIGSAFGREKSVIIGFHQQPGSSEEALIRNARGTVRRTHKLIPAIAAKLPEQEIDKMLHDPRIAYIEEDAIVSAIQPLTGEYANSWGVQHIGAEVAHNNHIMGQGVKIAILDTGIDYNHPDLKENYKGGYNFVCDKTIDPTCDNNAPMDDSYNSHGTNVAGIIGARENGFGVIGVAPGAELYAVKVLDGSGYGLTSWLIAGIEWTISNGIDIVNLSLEGENSQSLKGVCDSAYQAGLVLVAAAGNTNGGEVTYPAKYDSVIAVTATDKNDSQWYDAAIGPEVELSAPGVDIYSTAAGGGYAYLSGTSQAAPHIAGTAALIISAGIKDKNSDINIADEVRLKLQKTANDLGDPEKDNVYGYGLVDAAKAVSIPEDILIALSRTGGSPRTDAEMVSLSGAHYTVTIKNKGLSKIKVEVYANGVYRNDLSFTYHFRNSKSKGVYRDDLSFTYHLGKRQSRQELTFPLDGTGKTLDSVFIPYGKLGSSADIIISQESLE